MPSTMLNMARGELIRYLVGRQDMQDTYRPATWYLGLSSTEPLSDGSGVTEPTISEATGYNRVAIPNTSQNFTVPSSISNWYTANVNKIEFPELKVDCGVAKYYFLANAPTGGIPIMSGKFVTDRILQANSSLTIGKEDMQLSIVNSTT